MTASGGHGVPGQPLRTDRGEPGEEVGLEEHDLIPTDAPLAPGDGEVRIH
jgi:hypothetical protein